MRGRSPRALWIVTAAAVTAGAGCEGGPSPRVPPLRTTADHDPLPLSSAGSAIEIPSNSFPTQVLSVEDRLLLLDIQSDSALHMYDSAGGLLDGIGRKGSGPGEFLAPWTIFRIADSSKQLLLYDVSNRRITPVTLSADRAALVLDSTAAATIDPLLLPIDFAPWGAETLLASVMNAEAGVVVTSLRGDLVRVLVRPDTGADSRPMVSAQVAQARIATHPERTGFALAARYAPWIRIYDSSGNLTGSAQVPVEFAVRFSIRDPERPGATFDGTTRLAYLDVESSRSAIFALFSGRAPVTHPQREYYGDQVHVFGWDGKLFRVLTLDREVIDIDVSGDRLWAIVHDPAPMVVKYVLPSGLGGEAP